ncbi:MAG: GT4 family glycosyltransferase PelF [Spirochaetes bacterium]|nr:GT4 family glycosyltransferase PelF [Spirochaetota bacterium]
MALEYINKPDPAKKTICLIAEGSYPYITGGVSSWIQDMISGLVNFNFIVLAITADEDNEIKYKFPDNVTAIDNRILTAKQQGRKRKIDKGFFVKIKELHLEMMKHKEFSGLASVIKIMQTNKFFFNDIVSTLEAWDMTCGFGSLHNPLYPFSDYFWAWMSSHEYILKILTWDIPRADLYHTISTGYAGLVSAIAKIMYNKPVILTEHGLYNKEREIDIKRAKWVKGYQRDLWINIFNDLSKMTYDYADLTISLFEHNRNIQISQGARREKTLVIPNGVEVERFLGLKNESREEYSVGFVGRVVPIKDVKAFIIAAKIAAESIEKVKFYIIGPQDEDEAYDDECRLLVENFKLEDKVEFTGKADVRKYYSFIDVLVLSSIREAQPLVIIEAYLAGIPVISTRVGNVPEMLDYEEDLLADPKDSAKIASGIIKLYNDENYRNKLIKKNKDKALKFYNKKDLIENYNNLYNKYIASAGEN